MKTDREINAAVARKYFKGDVVVKPAGNPNNETTLQVWADGTYRGWFDPCNDGCQAAKLMAETGIGVVQCFKTTQAHPVNAEMYEKEWRAAPPVKYGYRGSWGPGHDSPWRAVAGMYAEEHWTYEKC